MAVSILIVTHGDIGKELIKAVTTTFGGELPLTCETLSVSPTCNPEQLIRHTEETIASINDGSGVLILTDIYGATPSNIANHFDPDSNVKVIAGVNLPMLIKVLNYPDCNLESMATKAVQGGHDGVLLCEEQ